MKKITFVQPDDWHLHLRSGAVLKAVLPHTARRFGRAIIMPNLQPPVTTVQQAERYRQEILAALPEKSSFKPLMVLYLTDSTTEDEIKKATASPHVYACKLYPAGVTTHSARGVSRLPAIYPVLESMQQYDIPLLIHGEVSDDKIDIFDRERKFIDTHLTDIIKHFPQLRIVLEHVTTREAVQFVEAADAHLAATLTPQHLMFNRNALLAGGIRPHYYCLPVIKRETHREALVQAATSGNPKFFLGTDSAPHLQSMKESACGCAGCFSSHAALEFYVELFEQANALDKLEAFASFNGADFYRLPRNTATLTLEKSAWLVPESYPAGNQNIIPLQAGKKLMWRLAT